MTTTLKTAGFHHITMVSKDARRTLDFYGNLLGLGLVKKTVNFDDPERMDVRRDPNRHVGFGGPGPHFCLGANLARREVEVVLRQLLTRLPDVEVAGPSTPLDAAVGPPLVAGLKRLPIRFTPTAPRTRE